MQLTIFDQAFSFRTKVLTFVVSCLVFSTAPAQEPQSINLLTAPETVLVTEHSNLDDKLDAKRLTDDDRATVVKLDCRKSKPLVLVYKFGDETIVANELNVETKSLDANLATVEILVSSLSATSGYLSLRIEPLRASAASATRVKFEPVAAKWAMVIFTPLGKDVSLPVSEISLTGTVGQPESAYKFDESPVEAINVIAKLKSAVDVTVSADEALLFEDASDGMLDDWSFAEAALLASGVGDRSKRQGMLSQIDQLEKDFKARTAKSLTAFQRGEELLKFLHEVALTGGYQKYQTDVSGVLQNRKFNCVSSATLYNIVAKRIGLDARGIEVPDHAFSILYDGTKHADIETTNPRGFNPARNKAALEQFSQQTGFVYIPDSHRGKRREIGDAGLVALTYYNHGVGHAKAKNYDAALVDYFKALCLDPKNKSAAKNVLAAIANWSGELRLKGELDRSLEVLSIGLDLVPDDRTIKHNHKVIRQQKAVLALDKNDLDTALEELAAAYEQTKDKEFLRLQSWVYKTQGIKKLKAKDWEGAIQLGTDGIDKVDEAAKVELKRWLVKVFLGWSNEKIGEQDFAAAADLLERGDRLTDRNYQIRSYIGFVVQEWGKHVKENDGDEAARTLVTKLAERFPDNHNVQTATSAHTQREARKLIEAGDFLAATKLYAIARKDRPNDHRLKQSEESAWIRWASPHLESRDWQKAMDIYRKARAEVPGSFSIGKNITYIVQEWSRDIAISDGIAAAEKLILKQAEQFPKISSVKRLNGLHLRSKARTLVDGEKFEEAESLILDNRDLVASRYELEKIAVYVFSAHAKEAIDKKQWEQAISIFEKGRSDHPQAHQLKTNLVFAWSSRAKEALDKEEWQNAIDIYEQALLSLPHNSTFKNNIKYCKSKLK